MRGTSSANPFMPHFRAVNMRSFRIFHLFLSIVFIFSLLAVPVSADGTVPERPTVNCGNCLLADLDSDTILYQKDINKKITPASVTKIMTALVVLRHIDSGDLSMDTVVTASKNCQKGITAAAAVGHIQPGEQLTIRELLHMMLIASHCDASNVLAEAVSGSISEFGKEMTSVAKELGCTGTHFVNPHGLHNKDHYTTCQDLYLMSKAAYQYEDFRNIVKKTSYTVPATNLSDKRTIKSTNRLLTGQNGKYYRYKYCVGGKTGFTFDAGYCLISFAEKDGRMLCCVMMKGYWLVNADGSRLYLQFTESKALYEWAFEAFDEIEVCADGKDMGSLPVTGAGENSFVPIVTKGSLSALLPKNTKPEAFTFETDLPDTLKAPVYAGDTAGTVTISLDGKELGTLDLITTEDVKPLPKILSRLDAVLHEPRPDYTPYYYAGGGGAVLLLALVLLLVKLHPKKSL